MLVLLMLHILYHSDNVAPSPYPQVNIQASEAEDLVRAHHWTPLYVWSILMSPQDSSIHVEISWTTLEMQTIDKHEQSQDVFR